MPSIIDRVRNLFKIRIASSGNLSSASGVKVPVIPGVGEVSVVDTSLPPSAANIPGSWARAWMGPGQPISPMEDNARSRDKEMEPKVPRSFQYTPSVNSTIIPRLSYGLTSFADLRTYAESVPEVAMCLRLLTEEIKAFVPTIVDKKTGEKNLESEYQWMTEHPDRVYPWPVWLSRFLYNVLVYDAGCAYLMRDKNRSKIQGVRVIDGSTIFVIIDESSNQPKPPAPAFAQIIWGTTKSFLNTKQLWYKPRHLRADAPYGRSPIEDCLPAVKLLQELWGFEYDKYRLGNIPELLVTVPEGWKDNADAVLEYEEAWNARMAGSSQERVRLRFIPHGFEIQKTPEITFNKESYDAATNSVRMAYSILQSEVGEGSQMGLGGKGYAEAMQSAFYRMGIAPLTAYIESLFTDVMTMNGNDTEAFKLEFPAESLDPEKEETKYATRFQIGGIKRDEYRQGIGMEQLGGELGDFIVEPGKGGEEDGQGFPGFGGNPVRVKSNIPVKHNVDVLDDPLSVLDNPVPVKKSEDIPGTVNDIGIEGIAIRNGYSGDITQFLKGFKEEQEHYETVQGNEDTIARIAIDHLKEDPRYYDKLAAAMDKIEQVQTLAKLSGVDAADDKWYGARVFKPETVNMPHEGANESDIVSIGDGDLSPQAAVWKPEGEEKKELCEHVGGPMFPRAEAAYLLDRELAPDDRSYLIPVTFTAEIDDERGSVQMYVENRKPRKEAEEYADRWIEQAAVLDYVMGQTDRQQRNWITHPFDDLRPVLIDSDMSFPKEDKKLHSSFVNAMSGAPVSEKMLDMLYLTLGNKDLWEDLREVIGDDEAVENARKRAEALYESKKFPQARIIVVTMDGSGKTIDVVQKAEVLSKAVGKSNGAMVAIDIPANISSRMSDYKIDWPEGSELLPQKEMHVTLAYLGDTPDISYDKSKVVSLVQDFVKQHQPLEGRINGIGRFLESHKEGMNCIYANFDCSDLPKLREALVNQLQSEGCQVMQDHGFTPHITLAYIPQSSETPDTSMAEVIPVTINGLSVYWNDDEPEFLPFTKETTDPKEPIKVKKFSEAKHARDNKGRFAPKNNLNIEGGKEDASDTPSTPSQPNS